MRQVETNQPVCAFLQVKMAKLTKIADIIECIQTSSITPTALNAQTNEHS